MPGYGVDKIDVACPVWNIEMRALKIAGAALAAVIVAIVLLLVIGIPSGFLTSQIQDRVAQATGYRLTIAGTTRVGLWPSLNVTLNDVTLQDPKDRDVSNRLTVGSVRADMTLASVWSGHPQITELVIAHPVVYMPLRRERNATPSSPSPKPATNAGTADANAFAIERVKITDGAIVLSNLRDRVEHRIDGLTADARIGADRKIVVTGNARSGEHPLTFGVKATAPNFPVERQTIPIELTLDSGGLLAGAAVGEVRHPAQRRGRDGQWPERNARRQRVQRMGVGRFLQQAAGETGSGFSAAGYRDAESGRCVRAASLPTSRARSRGATPRSTLPA